MAIEKFQSDIILVSHLPWQMQHFRLLQQDIGKHQYDQNNLHHDFFHNSDPPSHDRGHIDVSIPNNHPDRELQTQLNEHQERMLC